MGKLNNYKASDGSFIAPGKWMARVKKVEPKEHAKCTAFMVYFDLKNPDVPTWTEFKKGMWISPNHPSEFVQRNCGDLLVALAFVEGKDPSWPSDHNELVGKTCKLVLRQEEYVNKDLVISVGLGIEGFYTIDDKSPSEHIAGKAPTRMQKAIDNCKEVKKLSKNDKMKLDANLALKNSSPPSYNQAEDAINSEELPF